jgi:hypothetical protein
MSQTGNSCQISDIHYGQSRWEILEIHPHLIWFQHPPDCLICDMDASQCSECKVGDGGSDGFVSRLRKVFETESGRTSEHLPDSMYVSGGIWPAQLRAT